MRDDHTGDHVDRIVRASRFHGENLTKHHENGVIAPPVPSAGPKLVEMYDAGSNMPRVEEIGSDTVWYEFAEPARKVPIITLWKFKCVDPLDECPQSIERQNSENESPCGSKSEKSISLHTYKKVHGKRITN